MNEPDPVSQTEAFSIFNHQSDDPVFMQEVERLHQLMVYTRWMVVLTLWLIVGGLSLWSLRSDIELWLEYFTWAAVRYSLFFNRPAAIGLGICIGATLSVLIWQSRNILIGLPAREQDQLKQRVLNIRRQGESHPLWRWLHPSSNN